MTAKDQATAKSQSISIKGSTRLSEDEKNRLVEEVERYAEQDKKRREQADMLNMADNTCYQAEKLLAEYRDKLSEELVRKV